MLVINYDYNLDGYEDLFIGGRVISNNFGESPKSYLLLNQKNGTFKMDKIFNDLGMITDAKWEDFNGDGIKDLVTCGDWNNINLFYNDGNNLVKDSSFIGNDLFVCWFSIETADFNNYVNFLISLGI